MGRRGRSITWAVTVALLAAVGSLFAPGLASAKPGDILVADSSAGTVLRLNPKNGDVDPVSDDAKLEQPAALTFGPDGNLYVADYGADKIFKVNPKTGKAKTLADSAKFAIPDGIARARNGDLYVTDLSSNALFRVTVPGGKVKTISDKPAMSDAIGVVAPPIGDPFVEGDSGIYRVSSNGDTHKLTDNQYTAGDGLTQAADGTLYVVDDSSSKLQAVNPKTGKTKDVGPGTTAGYSLTIDFLGRVIAQDGQYIHRMDPTKNTDDQISNAFSYAEGVAVEPPTCKGQTATIVGTTGKDHIKGSKYDDVIATLGGDDEVDAGKGDDRICTSSGDDDVDGGPGHDRCDTGPGHDHKHDC
jgi:outer membrane protein assembly factor BamB